MNGHINIPQIPVHFGVLAGSDLSGGVRNAPVNQTPGTDVAMAMKLDLQKRHLAYSKVRDDILSKIELSTTLLLAGLHLFSEGKAEQASLVIKGELTRLQSAGMKLESVNTSINECARSIKNLN